MQGTLTIKLVGAPMCLNVLPDPHKGESFYIAPSVWLLVHILDSIVDLGPKCVTIRILGEYLGILGDFPRLTVGRAEMFLWLAEIPSKQRVTCPRVRGRAGILSLAHMEVWLWIAMVCYPRPTDDVFSIEG